MGTVFERFGSNRTIRTHVLVALLIAVAAPVGHGQPNQRTVEQWDIFELSLDGPRDGNPFLDVELSATFTRGDRAIEVNGFYDGSDKYLVRFMPDATGRWSYVTESSEASLDGKRGTFQCRRPAPDNHGPVPRRALQVGRHDAHVICCAQKTFRAVVIAAFEICQVDADQAVKKLE